MAFVFLRDLPEVRRYISAVQTYGQIVQGYAKMPSNLMGCKPRFYRLESTAGVQRYGLPYKVCRDAHNAAPTP